MIRALHFYAIFACFSTIQCQYENNYEEAVDRSDALLQSWDEFVQLQTKQTAEFNRDFPADDRLFATLKKKCGRPIAMPSFVESAESLPPTAIQIYAEIGHLSTFCSGHAADFITHHRIHKPAAALNLSEVVNVFKSRCLDSLHAKSKKPSLPKMLSALGAKLEVFESNIRHSGLQAWTRHIVRMIQNSEKMRSPQEQRWKLIILAPGLYDLRVGESTEKLAHDTMQSLQQIQHKLPSKTIVLLLRNSNQFLLRYFAEQGGLVFCEKMLSLWRLDTAKSDAIWDTLEARIKENYHRDDFYVHIVDILDAARPLFSAQSPDVSILSPDCIHLSSRGLSLLHIHLWNWLLQPIRQTIWKPLVRPLFCPRPACPFIVTTKNTRFCSRVQRELTFGAQIEIGQPLDRSQMLTFGLLGMSTMLYLVLFVYIVMTH
ncbi:phospholipase B1, membrane-associated [Ditylenchus destructor]|nr:phospholipase B1, membrane-associated [Ditylenchus destructor]